MKHLFAGSEAVPPIHVVDDDTDMLMALRLLLEGVGYVVHTYEDGSDFLRRVEEPDGVLILDLRLKGISGLRLQQRVAHHRHLEIIFISGTAEVPDSVTAMKAGACDFLVKPFREHEMLDAVARAMEQIAKSYAVALADRAAQQGYDQLTETEREIARLVASGLRNKKIAALTGKAENTVKVHRSRIMQKLGVTSAYELMLCLRGLNIDDGNHLVSSSG